MNIKLITTVICQALYIYLNDESVPKDSERYKIAFIMHDFAVNLWEDLHLNDDDAFCDGDIDKITD